MNLRRKLKRKRQKDSEDSFLSALDVCRHCFEQRTCPYCGDSIHETVANDDGLFDITFTCDKCGPVGGFFCPDYLFPSLP